MSRVRALVAEHDSVLRGVLLIALNSQGYDARAVSLGQEAIEEVELHAPDVMLLDLELPDVDGVEVAQAIRSQHGFPIIILSERGDEQQQIRALDGGANDYVVKPFREGELMARIRAALRRPVHVERRELRLGDLTIDPLERRVFVRQREVRLTPTEFRLLYVLARQPGTIFSHEQLLSAVWDGDESKNVHNLRVYMRLLRNKVESDPLRPARLVTELGVGYRLVHRRPRLARSAR